jgi:hypothetical protein
MRDSCGLLTLPRLLVEPAVDAGDLFHPTLPVAVLQRQDLLVRPVEMKRDVRYLLVQPL